VPAALAGALDGRRRVAVVDREGAYRALVVADVLSARGAEVVFLTPLATVSPSVDGMSRTELAARLAAQGVHFRAGLDAARWHAGALVARDAFNAAEERLDGIEGVVIVGPSVPVNELAAALDGRTPELHVIGDANQPRTVEEATFQGGRVGRLL
jgi:dimethylglycine catabolism A